MTGIGTLVNVCAIILGGFLGLLFKGGLKQHYQDAVLRCLGLCTLFIGAAGGLSGLLSVSGTRLESGGSLGMILSLVLGTLVGERLNLEGRLGQLGEWLKARASRGEDSRFGGGLRHCLPGGVCRRHGYRGFPSGRTGPRSLHPFHKGHPGLHDYHGILLHLRQGAIFSALPVGVLQGSVTLFAGLLAPLLSGTVIDSLSFIGSLLIFCVGVNLAFGDRSWRGHMLPVLIFGGIWASLMG